MKRASWSAPPPVPAGAMNSTGLVGSQAACAAIGAAATTATPSAQATARARLLAFCDMTPPRVDDFRGSSAAAGFSGLMRSSRQQPCSMQRFGSSYAELVQIRPAPRAHLYFAPSTATGISVEYG